MGGYIFPVLLNSRHEKLSAAQPVQSDSFYRLHWYIFSLCFTVYLHCSDTIPQVFPPRFFVLNQTPNHLLQPGSLDGPFDFAPPWNYSMFHPLQPEFKIAPNIAFHSAPTPHIPLLSAQFGYNSAAYPPLINSVHNTNDMTNIFLPEVGPGWCSSTFLVLIGECDNRVMGRPRSILRAGPCPTICLIFRCDDHGVTLRHYHCLAHMASGTEIISVLRWRNFVPLTRMDVGPSR